MKLFLQILSVFDLLKTVYDFTKEAFQIWNSIKFRLQ